ncbi:MAG: DnaD domain protein [Eubacterium sp.]|nr:DnaD domain protein [Eubacterium sp.]
MDTINIASEEDSYTSISNNFIKYYMTDANGDFVKLYLYLSMLSAAAEPISFSKIADHLNCTEKDVCRGIKYWIKQDVLRLSYNDKKEVTGIILKTLKKPDMDITSELKVVDFTLAQSVRKSTQKEESKEIEEITKPADVQTEALKAPRKKQPSPEDLSGMLRDPEIHDLINEATAYCNRELAQKELNSLIYIKDQLGFSFDLCEYLLEYCAEIKKTSFSYIEKVAKNWYEEGISNRDEAEEYSTRYLTLYSRILKTLGITSRFSPAPVEKKFIDTWTRDYGFSDTIIIEACNRAITSKPHDANFPYVNGILEKWYKNNVHSLSDIAALDESHAKNSKPASRQTAETKKSKTDKLRQLEQFYLNEG